MYIPEHDVEVQHALRVLAETRKMLELGGDVAGLQALNQSLAIQRITIQASTVRASSIRWRRIYDHAEAIDRTHERLRDHMSEPAYKRVWGRLVGRLLFRALDDRKE